MYSSLGISAEAAIKSGDSCLKLGQTTVSKGFKHTCVFKGKKKVWSTGVKIASPSNSSAAASPTPTPAPIREITLEARWTATGSRVMEGYAKVFPQRTGVYPELETVWRISDRVSPIISAEIQKQYKESISFWSAYTKHRGTLQVIIGNLDDIDFVCKWRSSYLNVSENGCSSSFRQDKNRTWDAHTTQTADRATDFYFMSDPKTLNDPSFWPRIPHEFFHNVQYAQTIRYKFILPCWAEEGGAEFYGIILASKGTPDPYLKMRYNLITDPNGQLKRTQLKLSDWVDWLKMADMTSMVDGQPGWGCQSVHMEGIYSYGFMATEYLNLKLGIDGVLSLYRDAGNLGWEKAIEKSFGTSKAAAYEEIANYMKNEYDIAIKQTFIR